MEGEGNRQRFLFFPGIFPRTRINISHHFAAYPSFERTAFHPSTSYPIHIDFLNRSPPLSINSLISICKKKKRKGGNNESIDSSVRSSAPGTPYRGATIRREFGIGLEDNARVESVQRRSVAVCLGRLRITYSQRELLFDRSSARPSASMHAHTRAYTHKHAHTRTLSLAHTSAFFYVHARDRARELTHRERERGARSPQVVRGKEGVNTRLHTFAMPRCSPVALNEPRRGRKIWPGSSS